MSPAERRLRALEQAALLLRMAATAAALIALGHRGLTEEPGGAAEMKPGIVGIVVFGLAAIWAGLRLVEVPGLQKHVLGEMATLRPWLNVTPVAAPIFATLREVTSDARW